jgi:hypothetical protein
MSSSSSQKPDEHLGLLKTLASVFSGVLFGLFLSKFGTPINESNNSISPTTKTRDQNDDSENLPPLVPQIPPSPANPENSCKCCHHKMPRWKIALEIGILVFTGGAFFATAHYARTAKEQLEANERPRMALDQERGQEGITLDRGVPSDEGPKTVTFFLRYSLRNFGHSPAQVNITAEIVNQDGGSAGSLTDRVKTKCDTDYAKVKAEDTWPETIVKEGSFGKNENQLKITVEMRENGFINPSVIGCIWYRSPTGGAIYRTGFAGQISMRTDDDWNREPIPLTLFRNGIPSTIERSKLKVVDILMSNAN